MLRLLLFLFVFSGLNVVLAYNGLLLLQTSSGTTDYCVSYTVDSAVPNSREHLTFYSLANFTEWKACTPLANHSEDVTHKMVMVNDGTCTTLKKTYIVQNEDAGGILIIKSSQNKTKPPPFNKPDNFSITIPVVFISVELSETILGYAPDVKISVYDPPLDFLDWILVVMWLTAMFCVTIGSYWAGVSYYSIDAHAPNKDRTGNMEMAGNQEAPGITQQTGTRRSQVSPETSVRYSNTQIKMTYISVVFIIALVAIMCVFLLLLYYFYNYLVYVIIGLFFIASSTAMYLIIDALTHLIFPCKPWQFPEFRCGGVTCRIEFTQVILAIACLAVGSYWVYIRNEPYSWILQDILGVFFCIHVLRTVRLPNMMIITVLLVLLFFYDIFFVFITPLLTKSKKSIMVDVATGGDSSNGEKLPLVFKFPHTSGGPLGKCLTEFPYSVLGFGDVLIPGMAIAFVHGFDLEVNSKRAYFIASVIAYGIGLILTFMGLALIQGAQPALLYLVPCLLITIFTIALIRHEVKAIWQGEPPPETAHNQTAQERLPAAGTPTQDTSESPCSSGFPSTSEATEERRLIDQSNNT